MQPINRLHQGQVSFTDRAGLVIDAAPIAGTMLQISLLMWARHGGMIAEASSIVPERIIAVI